MDTGHYTQVVWGNTFAVGCGAVKHMERGTIANLIVCNYGPGELQPFLSASLDLQNLF